jgi:hypothetical protein
MLMASSIDDIILDSCKAPGAASGAKSEIQNILSNNLSPLGLKLDAGGLLKVLVASGSHF